MQHRPLLVRGGVPAPPRVFFFLDTGRCAAVPPPKGSAAAGGAPLSYCGRGPRTAGPPAPFLPGRRHTRRPPPSFPSAANFTHNQCLKITIEALVSLLYASNPMLYGVYRALPPLAAMDRANPI